MVVMGGNGMLVIHLIPDTRENTICSKNFSIILAILAKQFIVIDYLTFLLLITD